jgi:glycosyltransferase involved in cell wall biosynthesis
MRVLHTEVSLHWGGQEQRVLEQCEWMLSHGHHVCIAGRHGARILQEARVRGVPHEAVGFRGSFHPGALSQLLGLIREGRFDVIDCHSSRDSSLAACLRLFGLPVVRSLHVETIAARGLGRWIWQWGSDRVIVVAQVLKERLVRLGVPPRKIDVIGEGVDFRAFDWRLDGTSVRAELGVDPACRLVTNIGMIRPDKGQNFFVEAAEQLAARRPEVRFAIVGSGTRAEFEQALRARVDASPYRSAFILTGYRHDVPHIIAASDCIAISSLTEAHSRVISQAYAMKRPVVATAVGGLPGIVREASAGTLVPPRDARALAAAVDRVLASDMHEETERGYRHVRRHLDFERTMAQTLATYVRAMNSHVRE